MSKVAEKRAAFHRERTVNFWCAVAESQATIEPLLQEYKRASAELEAQPKYKLGWRYWSRASKAARAKLEKALRPALRNVGRAAGLTYIGTGSGPANLTYPDTFNHLWCESCGKACPDEFTHRRPLSDTDAFRYRAYSRDFVDAVVLHTRHSFDAVSAYAARAGLRVTPLVYSWRGASGAYLFEREISA